MLDGRASHLSSALPQQSSSRYPLDEVTIELDVDTINGIINELTHIGKHWLEDTDNECHKERQQIMAYLLNQWIKVGEETAHFTQSANANVLH